MSPNLPAGPKLERGVPEVPGRSGGMDPQKQGLCRALFSSVSTPGTKPRPSITPGNALGPCLPNTRASAGWCGHSPMRGQQTAPTGSSQRPAFQNLPGVPPGSYRRFHLDRQGVAFTCSSWSPSSRLLPGPSIPTLHGPAGLRGPVLWGGRRGVKAPGRNADRGALDPQKLPPAQESGERPAPRGPSGLPAEMKAAAPPPRGWGSGALRRVVGQPPGSWLQSFGVARPSLTARALVLNSAPARGTRDEHRRATGSAGFLTHPVEAGVLRVGAHPPLVEASGPAAHWPGLPWCCPRTSASRPGERWRSVRPADPSSEAHALSGGFRQAAPFPTIPSSSWLRPRPGPPRGSGDLGGSRTSGCGWRLRIQTPPAPGRGRGRVAAAR